MNDLTIAVSLVLLFVGVSGVAILHFFKKKDEKKQKITYESHHLPTEDDYEQAFKDSDAEFSYKRCKFCDREAKYAEPYIGKSKLDKNGWYQKHASLHAFPWHWAVCVDKDAEAVLCGLHALKREDNAMNYIVCLRAERAAFNIEHVEKVDRFNRGEQDRKMRQNEEHIQTVYGSRKELVTKMI